MIKRLNTNKLIKNKNLIINSSENTLKDIIPIEWTKNVINGNKKVIVKIQGDITKNVNKRN